MKKVFKIGLAVAVLAGVGYAIKKAVNSVNVEVDVEEVDTDKDENTLDNVNKANEEVDTDKDENTLDNVNKANEEVDTDKDENTLDNVNKANEEVDTDKDENTLEIDFILNSLKDIDDSLKDDGSLDTNGDSEEIKLTKEQMEDSLRKLNEASKEIAHIIVQSTKKKVEKSKPKIEKALDIIALTGEKKISEAFVAGERWVDKHPDLVENIKKSSGKLTKLVGNTVENLVNNLEKGSKETSDEDVDLFKDGENDLFAERPQSGVDINVDLVEDPFENKTDDPFSDSSEPVLEGQNFENDLT